MDNYDRFDDENQFKQHEEHQRRENPSRYDNLQLIGPEEYENKSEGEKDRIYRENIYPELKKIKQQNEDLKEQNEDLKQQNSDQTTESQKWRKRSWGWRIISFVLGVIIGGVF
jgi:hypothetical protein